MLWRFVYLDAWLLFLYKVPHEPSSRRVYVWRQLKRLDATLLQDSVWVLPMSPRSLAQLQRLAREIHQLGGNALLWEAHLTGTEQDDVLKDVLQSQKEQLSRFSRH